ncbi:MAG: acyl-CoA carboxylase epsilon subunit [Trebonia sp.]
MTTVDDGPAPVITVTRGRPTPAELAAVIAVLLAAGQAGATATPAAPAPRGSAWAERSRLPGALPPPGPSSWRASAQPH